MGYWDELGEALGDAAAAFRSGSAVLISRGGRWIAADWPVHGGGAAFAGYVAVYEAMAHPHGAILVVPAAAVAWTGAALTFAPPAADQPDDQDDEPGLDIGAPVAACHEIGSPHAHLSALADVLDTTPEEVCACCAAAGIPVAGGVRMKGRGVSTGIRAADFPPRSPEEEPPTEGPLTSIVNSNNAGRKAEREGMLIFYDNAENGRHTLRPARQRDAR